MDSMQEQQLMQAMMQAEQNRRAEEEQKRREEELLRQQEEQRRQMEMQRMRQQQAQQQQQQGGMPGGVNPMQFMQGGEAAGGATPAAGSAAPAAEGGTAAGGGSAAGGSGGSALSSIGPWAALAAIIMANEKGGRDAGARDENKTHQARDAMTGRVVEQDFHQRWLPKMFGEDAGGGDYENDSTGFGADTHALADLTTFDPSNAWDTLRKNGSARKLWDKLF